MRGGRRSRARSERRARPEYEDILSRGGAIACRGVDDGPASSTVEGSVYICMYQDQPTPMGSSRDYSTHFNKATTVAVYMPPSVCCNALFGSEHGFFQPTGLTSRQIIFQVV